jgi:predicted nucleotidyltransferase
MPTDLTEYKEAWRRRAQEQEKSRKKLSDKALSQARVLAGLLKNTYQCEAVYLIGSLARREFREDSDIDLVVKGLKASDFYRASGELMAISEFPVDIIPFEEANELIKISLQAEGIPL